MKPLPNLSLAEQRRQWLQSPVIDPNDEKSAVLVPKCQQSPNNLGNPLWLAGIEPTLQGPGNSNSIPLMNDSK